TTRRAVCASQPSRTPQIASRPPSIGVCTPPAYASAASLYASRAGQTRNSAMVGSALDGGIACEGDQLGGLTLEAYELRGDEDDPDEHGEQDDGIRRGDVFLARAHDGLKSSRSSRRDASI